MILKTDYSNRVILDLCGGTGSWSLPYVNAGYTVYIIDLKEGFDVRLFLNQDWNVYGVLAAPDCTHFARSGARWWKDKGDIALLEGLSIVDACLRIIMSYKLKGCLKFWALENPRGRLADYLGEPQLKFHPSDYGDPYTKRTWVWGEFNAPKKKSVNPTQGSLMHKYGGDRDKVKTIRSITPSGFAWKFFLANR